MIIYVLQHDQTTGAGAVDNGSLQTPPVRPHQLLQQQSLSLAPTDKPLNDLAARYLHEWPANMPVQAALQVGGLDKPAAFPRPPPQAVRLLQHQPAALETRSRQMLPWCVACRGGRGGGGRGATGRQQNKAVADAIRQEELSNVRLIRLWSTRSCQSSCQYR